MGNVIEESAGGVVLRVKVVPGASRSGVAGVLGDRLKVRIAAPPEGGKANEAVCELIAKLVGVRPRAVSIESGHSCPEKTLRIEGVTLAAVRAGLGM